jgi:hypothetical protein
MRTEAALAHTKREREDEEEVQSPSLPAKKPRRAGIRFFFKKKTGSSPALH